MGELDKLTQEKLPISLCSFESQQRELWLLHENHNFQLQIKKKECNTVHF